MFLLFQRGSIGFHVSFGGCKDVDSTHRLLSHTPVGSIRSICWVQSCVGRTSSALTAWSMWIILEIFSWICPFWLRSFDRNPMASCCWCYQCCSYSKELSFDHTSFCLNAWQAYAVCLKLHHKARGNTLNHSSVPVVCLKLSIGWG